GRLVARPVVDPDLVVLEAVVVLLARLVDAADGLGRRAEQPHDVVAGDAALLGSAGDGLRSGHRTNLEGPQTSNEMPSSGQPCCSMCASNSGRKRRTK